MARHERRQDERGLRYYPTPDAADPRPEPDEPRIEGEGDLRDLTSADWKAIFTRAGKKSLDDQITDSAAAVTYYAFQAIPAMLLLSVGVFSLVAGPSAIQTIVEKLGTVVPAEAVTLIEDSLTRVTQNQGSGIALLGVGTVLGLWTVTSATQALMRGLNNVYDRDETRGFLKGRLVAAAIVGLALMSFVLLFGALVLGPYLAGWIGSAIGLESIFSWVWWTAQWPILLLTLTFAVAAILYLGPNVEHPRWSWLSAGAAFAVVVWLAASGLFALYVSFFGSYNKAWGSLAAVIILLTWLWLSVLAILFGAEVNAEAERSRELRRGAPAERELVEAPPKE